MSSPRAQHIRDKIRELQALFELVQQTMPFLEELFRFIEDIEPLLDEINHSIPGTTRKLPDAQSKLQSVTEATELATTEILDIVDEVTSELGTLEAAYERYEEDLSALRKADEELLALLESRLDTEEHSDLLAEVQDIHQTKQSIADDIYAATEDEREVVETMRQQMTEIMMALQVQDITSQQIAAVNHIIETLRDRMTRLLQHSGLEAETDMPDENDDTPADGTFDGNAEYAPTGSHQATADALIESLKNADSSSPPSSNPSSDASPSDASDDAAPDEGEVATQEDIDELFS